jgi:hypothetical protein
MQPVSHDRRIGRIGACLAALSAVFFAFAADLSAADAERPDIPTDPALV